MCFYDSLGNYFKNIGTDGELVAGAQAELVVCCDSHAPCERIGFSGAAVILSVKSQLSVLCFYYEVNLSLFPYFDFPVYRFTVFGGGIAGDSDALFCAGGDGELCGAYYVSVAAASRELNLYVYALCARGERREFYGAVYFGHAV